MEVTTISPEPVTIIELTDHERFQLSRILAWFRTNAWQDSEDYRLSLDLSCSGIDKYLTERGR